MFQSIMVCPSPKTEEQRRDEMIGSYDQSARQYDANTKDLDLQRQYDTFCSRLPGKTIVDMGCGTGRDLQYFCEQGYDAVGVDLSVGMLAVAAEKVGEERVVCGDITDLTQYFSSDSIDGIWNCAAFVHMGRQQVSEALANAHRVLTSGGCVYIGVKHHPTRGEVIKESVSMPGVQKRYIYFSQDELVAIVESLGYQVYDSFINTGHGDERFNLFCHKT